MSKKIIQKVWGREEIITNTELYCSKFLILEKGFQCSLHCHREKDETFFIMAGRVEMEIDGKITEMRDGESIRINPGVYHRFKGLENTIIIETSTFDSPDDSYRVEGQESRRFDYAIS